MTKRMALSMVLAVVSVGGAVSAGCADPGEEPSASVEQGLVSIPVTKQATSLGVTRWDVRRAPAAGKPLRIRTVGRKGADIELQQPSDEPGHAVFVLDGARVELSANPNAPFVVSHETSSKESLDVLRALFSGLVAGPSTTKTQAHGVRLLDADMQDDWGWDGFGWGNTIPGAGIGPSDKPSGSVGFGQGFMCTYFGMWCQPEVVYQTIAVEAGPCSGIRPGQTGSVSTYQHVDCTTEQGMPGKKTVKTTHYCNGPISTGSSTETATCF